MIESRQHNLVTIGHIETPYNTVDECPRNIEPGGPPCILMLDEQYQDGLLSLNVGKEIVILYWFENVNRENLRQHSRKTGRYGGIFSLRTPHRPNPIGLAILKIEKIEQNRVYVNGLDCLNGTPLLDIKPAMMAECST